MKNLLKFLVFVGLLSAGIAALYDYRIKHGSLPSGSRRAPEKYTLATSPTIDTKQIPTLEALNNERRALVANVVQSVVSIRTAKRVRAPRPDALDLFEFFYGRPRQYQNRNPNEQALVRASLGSGVIVSEEGHIITNNHVVDQVDEIEVQLSDGRTRKARLVGADAQIDVAVLKLDERGVKPLPLGDSDAVQPGDFVLAIGNPFGFEETVTDGIISFKGRRSPTDGVGEYLQTNAAINPGNSGGPLINLRGEIIGINTAIISGSGGSQGIGFAIPSNTVRMALESLLKKGRIIRGYLGIQAQAAIAGQPDPNEDGVVVEQVVPGSPAEAAKVQPGDVIKKFNGREVRSFADLRNFVSQTELDKKVEIEALRGGKTVKLEAEIKEQPVDFATTGPAQRAPGRPRPAPPLGEPDEEEDVQPRNGANAGLAAIEVRDLTPELVRELDLPNNVHGVVVSKVNPGAATNELRAGDVIEEINQQPVGSTDEFRKMISSLDPNETQVLSVCRKRTRSFVVIRGR